MYPRPSWSGNEKTARKSSPLSSNGEQGFINSGHNMEIEAPADVSTAIRMMVDRIQVTAGPASRPHRFPGDISAGAVTRQARCYNCVKINRVRSWLALFWLSPAGYRLDESLPYASRKCRSQSRESPPRQQARSHQGRQGPVHADGPRAQRAQGAGRRHRLQSSQTRPPDRPVRRHRTRLRRQGRDQSRRCDSNADYAGFLRSCSPSMPTAKACSSWGTTPTCSSSSAV